MGKAKSWEVTDEFWLRVQPLIPQRQRPPGQTYMRRAGGGRKPKDARLVFEAIVYVLRTGCQWKALPSERFGSASSVHARFLEWEKAGVFEKLWAMGLAEYDEMEGIAWRWQSILAQRLVIHEVLIALLILMTAPVTTMILMSAALRRTRK